MNKKSGIKEVLRGIPAIILAAVTVFSLAGCENATTENSEKANALSYDDAVKELDVLAGQVKVTQADQKLDMDMEENSVASSLASIDTFPLTTKGNGDINIEIAGATEISAEDAPDNWLNVIAERFNNEHKTIDGHTVTVSVRKITSGEVVTYMADGGYQPDLYIPSNDIWGKMLDADGIETEKLTDRLIGNTAGILMKESTYETFKEKYGDVTVGNVLKAANAGDLVFGYTNPYTSSTGINILTAMLASFDSSNPLSENAVSQLTEYQKKSPTAAYTTAVLKDSASKGIIDAMVMEEQAYINTAELKSYQYVPQGVRHDHPVYTFGYVTDEKKQAGKMFVDYCMTEESQDLATKDGFNRHDEYQSQDSGLDGAGYLAAQRTWKQNKNGGNPVAAVFVADTSGSMNGTKLISLKKSLLNTMQYIDSSNYIGFVDFNDNVTEDLPIAQFDDKQRSYFSGAVKNLQASGSTATYNAVLVAMKMLNDYKTQAPNAKLMLFVLSDGEQNQGFTLNRIEGIVGGMNVPVYTIGYEMEDSGAAELKKLSSINEASSINASSEDVVNALRNLFNVNL